MIVPIRTATIARTAPTARVRRKRNGVTSEAATHDADPPPVAGPVPLAAIGAPEPRGRRQGGSKPSPAFLASLLALRRGG